MRLPILTLCGMSLLWGSQWILTPLLAETAAPFAAAALTFALASLSLFSVFLLRSTGRAAVSWRGHLILSVTLFAAPLTLLILAGQHGAAGWIPLTYTMLPLLAALAAGAWTPAMVVAPGAALALLNGTVPFASRSLPWAAAAFLAVALQAWALRYLARAVPGQEIAYVLAIQTAIAAALLGLASALADPAPSLAPWAQWSKLAIASLLAISVLGTALPYVGLYRLLTRGSLQPEQAAVTQWLQLLVAAVESAAFAHVRPGLPWIAAAVLLAACAWSALRPVDHAPAVLP